MKIESITRINSYILKLAILILITFPVILASIYFFLPHLLVIINPDPLLDPSVLYSNPKDIITNINPLRRDLESLTNTYGNDRVSIYLESLNSGANITINKDLRIFPMSLAKLPLALVIMNKVEQKSIKEDTEIVLEGDDLDSRSGNLYKMPAGTSISVGELVRALLIDSDNTAQKALLRNVNSNDFQSLIDATGLADLFTVDGKMSAKEYTRLYRTLYFSSYLEPSNSQKILKLLSQATFNEFLSKGIPPGVLFSHKYGEDIDNQIYLDSGIIYILNRPIMITVMIQGGTENQAERFMKSVGATTYNYIQGYNYNN
jgi:hypothetical protein